jgi:Na+-translocating ferredoxin:NAD+ oxidoreductase RnfD subunit
MFNKLKDARTIVIVNHVTLLIVGLGYFGLQRSLDQVLSCFAVTILCEIAFCSLFRRDNFVWSDRVLSAMVTSLGVLIFIVSKTWWLYAVIGGVSIASKYLIVNENRRHVFNPTCFAIVFCSIALSEFLFIRPAQMNAHIFPSLIIVGFGSIALWLTKRWIQFASYYLITIVLSAALPLLTQQKGIMVIGPELGSYGLLFAFLMFSDPKTSPQNSYKQWIFGGSIALLNQLLKTQEVVYSNFISLFVICIVFQLFSKTETKKPANNSSRAPVF